MVLNLLGDQICAGTRNPNPCYSWGFNQSSGVCANGARNVTGLGCFDRIVADPTQLTEAMVCPAVPLPSKNAREGFGHFPGPAAARCAVDKPCAGLGVASVRVVQPHGCSGNRAAQRTRSNAAGS